MSIRYESNRYNHDIVVEDGNTTLRIDVGDYDKETRTHWADIGEAESVVSMAWDIVNDIRSDDEKKRIISDYFHEYMQDYLEDKIFEIEEALTEEQFSKVCELLNI